MEAYVTIPAFEVPIEFKAEIINLIKDFGKKANIEIKNLEASNDEDFISEKVKNRRKSFYEFANSFSGIVDEESYNEYRVKKYGK